MLPLLAEATAQIELSIGDATHPGLEHLTAHERGKIRDMHYCASAILNRVIYLINTYLL